MTIYVETRDVPLDMLEPYPGNARQGDVRMIRESLRANGQYRSLIVRQSEGSDRLIVLAGNHTLKAMLAEKMTAARCEIYTCDDATALRINLVDNRTQDLAGYDDQLLRDLLAQVDDFTGTGWLPEDLDKIIAPEKMPEPGDADSEDLTQTWGVIIECDDEQHQVKLLDRLAAEGLIVRSLIG